MTPGSGGAPKGPIWPGDRTTRWSRRVLRIAAGIYEVDTPEGIAQVSLRGRVKQTDSRIVSVGDLVELETVDDGHHDDYYITTLMMLTDPTAVRYHQRVEAGEATINGLSIYPIQQALEVGKRLMEFRVNVTVEAIAAAMAGSAPTQQ